MIGPMERSGGIVRALVMAGFVLAATLPLVVPGFDATAGAAPTGRVVAPLPPLHVVHPTGAASGSAAAVPYLADPAGQRVILRGVAASGFEDQAYTGATGTTPHYPIDPTSYAGTCPANDGLAPDPPVCQDDFTQMQADGFNLVRLTINWSELEPTPGTYSTTFLDRIAQVVGWAGQQGIRVILDMHQDNYSRFLTSPADASVPQQPAPSGCSPGDGQDGAPAWAVFTDGKPSCTLDGVNLAESEAFLNFWDNRTVPGPQGEAPGTGLQDHYLGALEALATRFAGNPAVLGYEVMNEPQPGSSASLPFTNLYNFSDQQLLPFTERAIEALTGVRDDKPTCPASDPSGTAAQAALDRTVVPQVPSEVDPCAYPPGPTPITGQMVLFEPTGYSNLVDFAPQLSLPAPPGHPFSLYPDLVFAPHVYTHVFTLDTLLGGASPSGPQYPASYSYGYATAESEAAAYGAALLVTEFGDAPSSDGTILAGMVAAQRQAEVGTVFWTWKENCGALTGPCPNGWGVYSPPVPSGGTLPQNGPLDTARLALLTSNPTFDGTGSPPPPTQATPSLAPLAEPQARAQLDAYVAALGAPGSPAVDRSLASEFTALMGILLGAPAADPNLATPPVGCSQALAPGTVVGTAASAGGTGYWIANFAGQVVACGDAPTVATPITTAHPIVGMAADATGNGYWLVASDGGIFSFGDAGFHGSMGGRPLDQPVVGMAADATGNGYWLVASDGGIFSFGDAGFHGAAV